jgi:hypothetical protein
VKQSWTTQGALEGNAIKDFDLSLIDAEFLFDEDVVTYLNGIRDKVVDLSTKNIQLKHVPHDHPNRQPLADATQAVELDLGREFPKFAAVFKPYLKLANI